MNKLKIAVAVALLTSFTANLRTQASLVGDLIEISGVTVGGGVFAFTDIPGGGAYTVTSPLAVDLGVEFTFDGLAQTFGFSIISSSVFNGGSVEDFPDLVAEATASDLDWVGVPGGGFVSSVNLTSKSPAGLPDLIVGFTDHSVSLSLGPTVLAMALGTDMTYEWNYSFTADHSAVPEPAEYVLLTAGLGLMGMLVWRRRRGAMA